MQCILPSLLRQVVYDFEAETETETKEFKAKSLETEYPEQTSESDSPVSPIGQFTTDEEKEKTRKEAEIANKETRRKVSTLLEALFSSLLHDESKDVRSKPRKRAGDGNKGGQNSDDDEEGDEIIKVNFDHSRINRARKSLDKAVDLQKLPVIQEELTLAKKLNTNGDKNDQSSRSWAAAESINLDLGCPDSSWMEAGGSMTDSDEKDGDEEEENEDEWATKDCIRRAPSLTSLLDLNQSNYDTFTPGKDPGSSPQECLDRTDSGLGLNYENLELSLSRETLQKEGGEEWGRGGEELREGGEGWGRAENELRSCGKELRGLLTDTRTGQQQDKQLFR